MRGVTEYTKWEEEKNETKIREIKDVTNNLFAYVDGEDLEIYNYTKKINVEYLFKNLESLGSHFDGFIFESEAGDVGKKIVEGNISKVFTKSEGAVVGSHGRRVGLVDRRISSPPVTTAGELVSARRPNPPRSSESAATFGGAEARRAECG